MHMARRPTEKTKIVKPVSKFPLPKFDETNNFRLDQLSELPDEILVSILSLLTLKEAGRTSVLSRRWRYLWKFTTGSLDFDDSRIRRLVGNGLAKISLRNERGRFVRWVNHVLELHQGHTINEFKVRFDLDEEYCKAETDNWINFSLGKKVKRLSLDFKPFIGDLPFGRYTLTTKILDGYNLDCLTDLCLTNVEMNGEVLGYVLSNCPLIEVLHVEGSKSLVNFKSPGPLLKLKHLEVIRCFTLKKIEISAINLLSFKYCGNKIRMCLGDIPNLVEVSVTGTYAYDFVTDRCSISSSLSQLQTLEIVMSIENIPRFPRFRDLRNLRQLTLISFSYLAKSLLCCTQMLKASPFLHKFALKMFGLGDGPMEGKIKVRKAKHPHQCLKVVELIGFVGCTVDMELALNLINNAASLEKIIIDTRSPDLEEMLWDSREPQQKLAALNSARQLETSLPPGVEMVIL